MDIIYVILVDIICPTSKSQVWENMQCHNCGDWGHRTTNCAKRKACYDCKDMDHLSAECTERPVAPRSTLLGVWDSIEEFREAYRSLVLAEFDHERLEKEDWVVVSVEVTWLEDPDFAVATIYGHLPLRVGDKVFVDEEDCYVDEEDWHRHFGKIKEVRQSPECKKVLLHLQHPHFHDMVPSLCKVSADWHGTHFDIMRTNLFKAHEEKKCMSGEVVATILEKSYSPAEVWRREFRGESERTIDDMLKGYKLPSTVQWSSQRAFHFHDMTKQGNGECGCTNDSGPPGDRASGETRIFRW